MSDPLRGEVWLIDLGDPVGHEQAGLRPGLILSSDLQNSGPSGLVSVVPITRTRRGNPAHIELEPAESGLDESSYATCEQLRALSTKRLVRRIGRIEPSRMFSVGQAVRILLDL